MEKGGTRPEGERVQFHNKRISDVGLVFVNYLSYSVYYLLYIYFSIYS